MRRVLPLLLLGSVVFTPTFAAAEGGDDCAYELQPISQEGDRVLAEPVLIGCFDTYAEALAAGSDGALSVSSDTTPLTLSESTVNSAAASSVVLIGTEFDNTFYSGSSKSYYASATCSASLTWEVDYVTDTWNDRFSSGKGFGGCDRNRKFQHSQFGGSSVLCTPNCTNYGTLSASVSSLRWSN
ncbi:MAG: hypothetical protein WD096_07615 [Actinomycetota bacterium]